MIHESGRTSPFVYYMPCFEEERIILFHWNAALIIVKDLAKG